MAQVVAARVVTGPAFVGSGVLERDARDTQYAHAVAAVGRVDGDAPLPGAIPQLLEGVGAVYLGVPPLDLRRGVTNHVTVQLKGVSRELCLRHGRLHKPSWRGRGFQSDGDGGGEGFGGKEERQNRSKIGGGGGAGGVEKAKECRGKIKKNK